MSQYIGYLLTVLSGPASAGEWQLSTVKKKNIYIYIYMREAIFTLNIFHIFLDIRLLWEY